MSWILSIALHPLLMPTALFGIIAFQVPDIMNPLSNEGRMSVLFLIFLSTFVMPFLMILAMLVVSKKEFSLGNLQMSKAKERFMPFFFTSIFYLVVTYYLFSSLNTVILLIMAGITASTFITAVVSYFWKISAHAVGINGVIGFLMALTWMYKENALLYPLVIIILLSGALLSARLYLNAHTPAQVLWGAVLGFVSGVGSLGLIYFI
ncbi:hypothetical protein RCC89_19955 [Cytophagaceae bacterium ABcell3]|nr:hypothetical protein RCC89_19955 [Cytophagaceae bacterium ABcell3]